MRYDVRRRNYHMIILKHIETGKQVVFEEPVSIRSYRAIDFYTKDKLKKLGYHTYDSLLIISNKIANYVYNGKEWIIYA